MTEKTSKNSALPQQEFVSRASTVWLIVALLMVQLPVWQEIPIAISAVSVLSIVWRVLILLGRGFWPPTWLRSLLVVAAMVTVAFSFKPLISLESAVAVLAAGYSLKLLEMRSRRDALVVVYIGYFLIASSVLFSQTLLQTLYLFACIAVLTAAQQGLYRRSTSIKVSSTLRYAGMLALQAMPLTIILFLLVPRIGPLWSVPLPDNSARTGLTDEMTPGDIARLSKSDELVFRARFSSALPAPQERYWRAVVLDRFDGKTWRQSDFQRSRVARTDWKTNQPVVSGWWQTQESDFDYEIMMEPTGKPWLYSLGQSASVPKDSSLLRTLRLEANKPVDVRTVYSIQPVTPEPVSLKPPEWLRKINLQTPDVGNDRSRKLARQLWQQSGNDAVKMADRVMLMFRQEPFFYTLNPPLLTSAGRSSIDRFLFDSRQGFCSHYAGAFVYLMRAAGVPARVVGGYQGGEVKEEENLIQVRQFDAHAWAEIWVEGQGWLRYDPTAMVSPERINSGLEAALANEGSFLSDSPLSLHRYRQSSVLNGIRLAFEQLEYRWQRSVINYREEQQREFLSSLLGKGDLLQKQTLALIVSIAFLLLLSALLLLKNAKPASAELALYQRFSKKMARRGFQRSADETELAFAQRVSKQSPELAAVVSQFTSGYCKLVYGADKHEGIDKLKSILRQL
ncbi:DUF3488 domain-containing protein [Endozoicomonas sp. OPT23]|uniref:transglutaminase TgpA family protein n=1 Tax=Endozoicomonas sp. OPT23 TaxID=2072845 RepID=UPI00129B595E|nr:DUF3488 and transglutaminase-like domain-containing protein [Endozoicomonas sp. OPT23]MRI34999.1 DUF3488 domain-containing protein [Endozoicomonas sp. OPT23]